MPQPLIWLTGDVTHADFAPAVAWLREEATCLIVSAGTRLPCNDSFPVAILILQSRPGVVLDESVELLHRRAPLARLIALVGPWCEGELRSGTPKHGLTRIASHQWSLRLPRELELAAGVTRAASRRPRTFSDVDRLLCTSQTRSPGDSSHGQASVLTNCRQSFTALADACALGGLQSVWEQPESGLDSTADIVLIDGWEAQPRLIQNETGSPPAILLLDWPRPDDLARAAAAGMSRVLAKPLLLADLLATLDDLLGPASSGHCAKVA